MGGGGSCMFNHERYMHFRSIIIILLGDHKTHILTKGNDHIRLRVVRGGGGKKFITPNKYSPASHLHSVSEQ